MLHRIPSRFFAMRKRTQIRACPIIKNYKKFLIEEFRHNRDSFEKVINVGGIAYSVELYNLLKVTKLMTPRMAKSIPLRVHTLNLDRSMRSPESVREKINAIQTMHVDGNLKKLYEYLIEDCHLITKSEYDSLAVYIKNKLNSSRRTIQYFDFDEDMDKKAKGKT